MPWSDNSNNSGKGGPTRGPWGQSPKGNGSGGGRGEPPDLEELLQASRQRLRRAFPRGGKDGGPGGGGGVGGIQLTPRTAALGAGAVVLLWALSGIYQVGPQEQGVTTVFGKYSGITGPGLHWRAPMVQGVRLVPVDKQQTAYIGFASSAAQGSSEENLMLTSDRNIVDVSFSVDWKINLAAPEPGEMPNAAKYIFNIEKPEDMVKAVAESAMRETVGGNRLEPIITSGQAVVVEQTRGRIQEVLDSYNSGIEIVRVNMEKPEPPHAVRDAFADVIKARNEKAQMINEAQRAANQIIPVAEGEAQKLVEEARAYAARVEADSLGQADRFNRIYAEYRRAPEVTRQRMYLETMESVLGGMNKIMIDESAAGGVVPYLPLNELTRKP